MLKYGLIIAAVLVVLYFIFYKKNESAAPAKTMDCKKKIIDKNGNAIMVGCDTQFIREVNLSDLENVRPATDLILTHELGGLQSSGFTKYQ